MNCVGSAKEPTVNGSQVRGPPIRAGSSATAIRSQAIGVHGWLLLSPGEKLRPYST